MMAFAPEKKIKVSLRLLKIALLVLCAVSILVHIILRPLSLLVIGPVLILLAYLVYHKRHCQANTQDNVIVSAQEQQQTTTVPSTIEEDSVDCEKALLVNLHNDQSGEPEKPAQAASLEVFLIKNGMPELLPVFENEKIDLEAFLELNEKDLQELEIPMGPRKKILKRIGENKRSRYQGLLNDLMSSLL